MKKIYCQILLATTLFVAFSSCKMDPPVLPANLIPITDGPKVTDPGTGTNPGTPEPVNSIGLPIGGTNTIRIQLNSATGIQTFNQVMYNDVSGILDFVGLLNSDTITFSYVGDKTGTFDLLLFSYLDYSLPPGETGKVEVTVSTMDQYSKGTIKGGFTADVVNSSGHKESIRGSFNIKQ
ncbi:hypothetical protein FPZ42_03415 [Mucilaginibacter achroorhodeus]|uniref:Uncharacterized protein n=1 Tax=Mucilaginibacter achroorhodeus TaxID=2599294 RepID=A0A563UA62_9SPHI|nr:hypothetical protein [Mucilaginibacter achroorhodeus]TWR28277.1 hypothetical protein FPZ42_03415 [Mucilaginibacter achroorhodeus]